MHPECSFHRWLLGEVSVRKIAWFSVIFREGAAERKEEKRKSERPGGRERDGPVWRGSSKRTSEQASGQAGRQAGRQARIGDRSERLLGSGQCLATANFSSPCGRMTVTFFRSKAGRILSSGPLPSRFRAPQPFCLSTRSCAEQSSSRARLLFVLPCSFPPRLLLLSIYVFP